VYKRQGARWADDFERNRRIAAPATGRLYWLSNWNGQTNSMTKLTRDMWVWRGVPMAEIVDLGDLAFSAEVAEPFYTRIAVGDPAVVTIPGAAGARLDCTVTAKGQVLTPPRDLRAAGTQVLADSRVFTVRLALTLGPDVRGTVQPGMRGQVDFPKLSTASP
jgi:hypothetical protein